MVGNIPNYSKIDALRCFLRFNRKIGRQDLAKELRLGEGTVRTILELLKSKKLLHSTKKGHFLSKTGGELLNQFNVAISIPMELDLGNPYPEFKKIGILVKNVQNLKGIYKLRDIAVKNGADGAIILKFENKLYAPESNFDQDYRKLEKLFDFSNDDVLIVGFSNDLRKAENGALAIAAELSNILKKFINEI